MASHGRLVEHIRMNKRIEIACSAEIKDILVQAIRDYTEVAFPAGGSDCVLVAREAMLDAAHAFEREFAATPGHSGYNKRLRAMVKEALRLRYQLLAVDTGRDFSHECALLLDIAAGAVHGEAELAAARAADGRDTARE